MLQPLREAELAMSLWDPEPHSCLDFAWGLLCFGGLSLAIGAVVRLLCWLEMVT